MADLDKLRKAEQTFLTELDIGVTAPSVVETRDLIAHRARPKPQISEEERSEGLKRAKTAVSYVLSNCLLQKWYLLTAQLLPYFKDSFCEEIQYKCGVRAYRLITPAYVYAFAQPLTELSYDPIPSEENLKEITPANIVAIRLYRPKFPNDYVEPTDGLDSVNEKDPEMKKFLKDLMSREKRRTLEQFM